MKESEFLKFISPFDILWLFVLLIYIAISVSLHFLDEGEFKIRKSSFSL
jgi:hypothetical protein